MEVKATNDEVYAINNGIAPLSCSTNHNWKTCIWQLDENLCTFDYVFDESAITNKWIYNEVSCDPEFGPHKIIQPKNDDTGNNNTKCSIEIEQVTGDREYTCTFQRCNLEENNMCRTKVSKDCPTYSATVNVKVN